jgi:hypothetical protein
MFHLDLALTYQDPPAVSGKFEQPLPGVEVPINPCQMSTVTAGLS